MTTINLPDDKPKSIRETICRAQTAIGQTYTDDRVRRDIELLGRIANECDRHRPLGPDGNHGDRHTNTCGCEDVVGIDPDEEIAMESMRWA